MLNNERGIWKLDNRVKEQSEISDLQNGGNSGRAESQNIADQYEW